MRWKTVRLIDVDELKYSLQDHYGVVEQDCGVSEDFVEGAISGLDAAMFEINCALAVEAIPIEWILKWANRNCMYCYDYDYPTEKTDGWFDINNMVKDWGKENGLS